MFSLANRLPNLQACRISILEEQDNNEKDNWVMHFFILSCLLLHRALVSWSDKIAWYTV